MTSSETTPPAASPSSSPDQGPAPSPVTAAPLRVRPATRPTSSSTGSPASPGPSTPSATNRGAAGSTGFDPVDAASGSTRSPKQPGTAAVKIDTKSLIEVARAAVLTASRYVHAALARGEDEAEAELWIARDKDQAQIGDPLATIAGRRGLAGQVSPDVANLIEAGIGLVAYVAFHAGEAFKTRRARRAAAKQAGELMRHDTGQPA